jgi:hypothetical protein
MARIEKISIALVLLASASPAFATTVYQTPAPIAGLGIGAVALVGLGYRALKKRINP